MLMEVEWTFEVLVVLVQGRKRAVGLQPQELATRWGPATQICNDGIQRQACHGLANQEIDVMCDTCKPTQ